MMKIKALNDDTSTSEEEVGDSSGSHIQLTREAQEEKCYSLYSEALQHLKDGDEDAAKSLFLTLYDLLKNPEKTKKLASYERLRFLTLKNLGLICTDTLDYFLDALEIDDKDVALWIKTADRCFTFQNYPLARECLEECLRLSHKNWIAIDKLIDTYFILTDLPNCFYMCERALKMDEGYLKAQVLISEIAVLFPPMIKEMSDEQKKYLKISDEDQEFAENLLSRLRQLKAKRRELMIEHRMRSEAKRKKILLSLEITQNTSVATMGSQILKLHQKILDQELACTTVIDVLFEGRASRVPEDAPTTDESVSGEEADKEKEKEKEREKNKQNRAALPFPFEFLDKRRSTRVQKIQTRTRDSSDSITDKILQLLPPSVISRRNSVKETQPEEESKVSVDIEAECMRKIIAKQRHFYNIRHVQRIYDIIKCYLHEVSQYAGIVSFPDSFVSLYKIHRAQHELPFVPYRSIGNEISLEDIWCTLTANELDYRKLEGLWLSSVSPLLEVSLNEEKYHEFMMRLLVLRGTKESDVNFLEYAHNLFLNRSQSVVTTNKVTITLAYLKSLINSKTNDSNNAIDEEKVSELLELLMSNPESDVSDNELKLIQESIVKSESWEKGIEIVSARKRITEEYLKLLKVCVETGKRAKPDFDLTKKLIHIATESPSATPWICLFWIFEAERQDRSSEENFVNFVCIGHQHLGKKGTCTSSGGEFLLLALDFLINHCTSNKDDMILQCFSCLYGHPSRKNTYLQAHVNSPLITLTWQHAELIYSYFIPEVLPEFDTPFRNSSINTETEALLIRIANLVPDELNPKSHIKMVEDYIETGIKSTVGGPIESHNITHNLYYFLADYYFKNKEFKKAKLYYKLDLVLNWDRFDSWAASALARSSLIDQHLISGENPVYRNPEKLFKAADCAFRCYSRALQLDPGNTKLWIEYGSSAYNLASQASRLKKVAPSYSMAPKESLTYDVERLGQKHKELLGRAKFCFESANKTDSKDEIWLQYYLLGKIAEKTDLIQALRYYELADLYLFLNGASYPKKISYHNPSYLSIEALEVHYRIHSAALKFLTSTHKLSHKVLQTIKIHLVRALRSPFVKQMNCSYPTVLDHDYTSGALNSSSDAFGKTSDSVSELIGDIVEIVAERIDKVDENKLKSGLIDLCIKAMKRCLVRFGPHYKSLYRLAFYYYSTGDVPTAKSIFMNSFNVPIPPSNFPSKSNSNSGLDENTASDDSSAKAVVIMGLFAERKNNNLFNAIWRIPVDDIDRPGSFSAHMHRCTLLLIRICTAVFDYTTLCQVAIQLSKTPDAGKKYLRDLDRLRLAREAFDSCSLMLKNQLLESRLPRDFKEQIALEIYKVCDKFIKANVFSKDAGALVAESYKLVNRN